ncbi:alpha/beta hydrolase [Litorivicinus sp.]|jgi:alpha/beta superfamily hydrolase|nr:alpha/beta hydrolase [Litorivicinus sp.]|tara:strand:- start:7275 stop:7928 length:654 start_codon:yes stop_codon:yes gene_type:complete
MNELQADYIVGPAGKLEISSFGCSLRERMPEQVLLLLHPHPLHGGTMGNKVITTIARAARDNGLPAVAFNFRGAGNSEGEWDGGYGELADAEAVVSHMISAGVREVLLAGFSFGGSVAAQLISRLRIGLPSVKVSDLIQVAPAIESFPVDFSWDASIPVLVIFNQDDEVVSADAMAGYAASVGASAKIYPTGGHYFHGHLSHLKKVVVTHWREQGFA